MVAPAEHTVTTDCRTVITYTCAEGYTAVDASQMTKTCGNDENGNQGGILSGILGGCQGNIQDMFYFHIYPSEPHLICLYNISN